MAAKIIDGKQGAARIRLECHAVGPMTVTMLLFNTINSAERVVTERPAGTGFRAKEEESADAAG